MGSSRLLGQLGKNKDGKHRKEGRKRRRRIQQLGEITSRSAQVTKKRCQANDRDRISELHETVICNILSRLPSEDAVRTSILSKDWEYKWTSIYNIDNDDLERFFEQRSKTTSFVNFVDRVHFSQDLKSFRLEYPEKYYCCRLVTLISGALMRNIESFELKTNDPKGFVLPRSLVNNTSLRKLKLSSSCIFKVPLDNCFPNLTYLYLYEVEILNKLSNSDRLVFTFPVLKIFNLFRCKWSNVNLVEIYSPSLSTFKCETDWVVAEASGYSIKICGARLEKFESVGGFPENIIFYESVVLNATFDRNWKNALLSGIQVLKLMNGFSSTITDLKVSLRMCEAIAISKHELPLPQFGMLQRLSIDVFRNAKVLIELLHSPPSLKCLQIDWCSESEEYDFAEVDSVPGCVKSHLQEVKFVSARKKPVIHLAKFFLKNGVELKKIYIHDSLVEIFEQLLNSFSKFPSLLVSSK